MITRSDLAEYLGGIDQALLYQRGVIYDLGWLASMARGDIGSDGLMDLSDGSYSIRDRIHEAIGEDAFNSCVYYGYLIDKRDTDAQE